MSALNVPREWFQADFARPIRDFEWTLISSLKQVELLVVVVLFGAASAPFLDGLSRLALLAGSFVFCATVVLLRLPSSVQVLDGQIVARNPFATWHRIELSVGDVVDLREGRSSGREALLPLHLICQTSEGMRVVRLAAVPSTYMPALWVALVAQPNHRMSDWGFEALAGSAEAGTRSEAVAAELRADPPGAGVSEFVLESVRATTVAVVEVPAEDQGRAAARKGKWKSAAERLISLFQDAPELTKFVVVERDEDRTLRTSEAIWNLRAAVREARRWQNEA